jgi:tryptophan-rich sensory protein
MNGSTPVADNFSLGASDVINATYFPATAGDSTTTLFHRPIFDAIDLYVTPAWYVLGIPGNIMAFVVWVQRRMRPSSGYFLAALALDECIFLIMQVMYVTLRCASDWKRRVIVCRLAVKVRSETAETRDTSVC